MNVHPCRINIIWAMGESHAGDLALHELKRMTSLDKQWLVPEPIPCFVRMIDRFGPDDLDEWAAARRDEGWLLISEQFVAGEGELTASELATKLQARARQAQIPVALVGLVSSARQPLPPLPPTGLDYLVVDNGSLANHLAEAIKLLVARIWLVMPAQPSATSAPPSELDSSVVIDFPRTLEDFRSVLRLRFEIYRALGYLSAETLAAKSRLDLDAFDPNAVHLIARDTTMGEIVGCVRLIVPNAFLSVGHRQTLCYSADVENWCQTLAEAEESRVYRNILKKGTGGQPLPAAAMGAYEALRETLKVSHPDLRAENCCELSRLIVAPKARGQYLSRRLTEVAARMAQAWLQRKVMLIECREYHRSLYERMSFQLTQNGQAEKASLLRTTAITMWRDLQKHRGQPVRRPNAQVVLSAVTQTPHPGEEAVLQLRRVMPLETWVWSPSAALTDKGVPIAFELSISNRGLAGAVVRSLKELMARTGAHSVRIFNDRGESIELTRSTSLALGPEAVTASLLKLVQ